jgi:DNA-binding XRE family transcriptional regulator
VALESAFKAIIFALIAPREGHYKRKFKHMAIEDNEQSQELTNAQKKEYAKTLFMTDAYTQKQIAAKVGISERTMSLWVNDEKWETQKKTLLVTNEEQLKYMYECLDLLNKENRDLLADGDPETKPNIDGVSKLTKSIKNLQSEANISEMIQTGMAFIKFVQEADHEMSKAVSKLFDAFIKQRLNKIK